MDGFDQTTNVKVIMATNRQDTLDPALLRPGRLDRKIEFPLPDRRQKRLIFSTITSKMNLSEEVDLEVRGRSQITLRTFLPFLTIHPPLVMQKYIICVDLPYSLILLHIC